MYDAMMTLALALMIRTFRWLVMIPICIVNSWLTTTQVTMRPLKQKACHLCATPLTGDARICGSLASLVGLEVALESNDNKKIMQATNRILLLHSLIMSFGGIPLLYNGDALGLLNDYSYLNDPSKADDNRWVHRPKINWEQADQRYRKGSVECTVFNATKKMISVRKEVSAFADFNNRELIELGNEHLLCFLRFNHQRPSERVLVIANFNDSPQFLDLETLSSNGIRTFDRFVDLYTEEVQLALTLVSCCRVINFIGSQKCRSVCSEKISVGLSAFVISIRILIPVSCRRPYQVHLHWCMIAGLFQSPLIAVNHTAGGTGQ